MTGGPTVRVRPGRGRAAPGLSGPAPAPSEKRSCVPVAWPGQAWRPSHTWFSSSPDPAVYGGRACAGGSPVCPPGFATRGVLRAILPASGLLGLARRLRRPRGSLPGPRSPQCWRALLGSFPGRPRVAVGGGSTLAVSNRGPMAHGVEDDDARGYPLGARAVPRVRIGARVSESPGFAPH